MAGISLRDYQVDAVRRMKNGCILCGGVGSGKSRTAIAYYYLLNGGKITEDDYYPMDDPPKDLYIITTARKRDTLEWEEEFIPFLIAKQDSMYQHNVVIDSWNNIAKYIQAENAFFVFDEQRLVGNGKWVKTFLKIVKRNQWILLSATPGDTWMDYLPVFIANGFFKNRTDFINNHVIYKPFSSYPKIDRYINTGRLIRLRDSLLIDMDFKRETVSNHENIVCDYDKLIYLATQKQRINPFTGEPIINASELCYTLRKIVNSDESKQVKLLELFEKHPKIIVFYNYNYELDILKNMVWGNVVAVAEWNGHKHQELPFENEKWVYLVQYTSGCEGWNCIKTDTIVFFSQNYSYKVMEQARGRIDRMNTPFTNLYYYYLKSNSNIDRAIDRALSQKKKFNENKYATRR